MAPVSPLINGWSNSMTDSRKALVVLLSASFLVQSCAPDNPQRNTQLTVIGESTADASPDTAIVVLSVVTQNRQAIVAQQENARRSQAVHDAVKALLGDSATTKSSGYSLQPQQRWDNRSMPTIIGYEARNTVEITISNLERVGEVVDAATGAGANSVERISFELRNIEASHARSLAAATKQALAKAEAMARAVGGKVKRVVEGGELSPYLPPPVPYAVTDYDRTMNAATEQAATTPIPAGTVSMHTVVRLVVEVEGAS
jgi:uncharacterized protein YggE